MYCEKKVVQLSQKEIVHKLQQLQQEISINNFYLYLYLYLHVLNQNDHDHRDHGSQLPKIMHGELKQNR